MAKKYIEELTVTLEQLGIAGNHKNDYTLDIKHFFSGAAAYCNGKICMSLTPIGFALKLPIETRTQLLQNKKGITLRYFPKGPVKKEYIVLADSLLQDFGEVMRLVQLSIDYVLNS